MHHYNPIEVSLRDYKKAFDIIIDSGVVYNQNSQTEFQLTNAEDWNATMEAFENADIEIY